MGTNKEDKRAHDEHLDSELFEMQQERETTMEEILNGYHKDSSCGSCKGPLEDHRDAICVKCTLEDEVKSARKLADALDRYTDQVCEREAKGEFKSSGSQVAKDVRLILEGVYTTFPA